MYNRQEEQEKARQEAIKAIRLQFDSSIADEYIEEFEHQDGESCWMYFFCDTDGHFQLDKVLEDVRMYVAATYIPKYPLSPLCPECGEFPEECSCGGIVEGSEAYCAVECC